MKSCLVLEGGGMRGIYTAGVLDVFLENNIEFDAVIGVSAGAIHGCSFVSRQAGRSIRYYKKYCRDKRFMSIYSLLTTGSLVGEEFCYHDIPERLDPFDYETFRKSHTDFYAVCTDVEKGKPVYVLCDDLETQMDYLLASASMPMVSRIVEKGGRKLLDGGITDSIPFMAAKKLGFDKIVVVRTRHKSYRKKPEGNPVFNRMYKNYPNLIDAMNNRHIMYNHENAVIEKAAENGEIISIRPDFVPDIGRTEKDPSKLETLYILGRIAAVNRLSDVKEYLNIN